MESYLVRLTQEWNRQEILRHLLDSVAEQIIESIEEEVSDLKSPQK